MQHNAGYENTYSTDDLRHEGWRVEFREEKSYDLVGNCGGGNCSQEAKRQKALDMHPVNDRYFRD